MVFSGEAKWALLGDLDISTIKDKAQPKTYRIIQRYVHPNYRLPDNYNDIALFRLNETVKFTPFIRPICLHTSLKIPPSEKDISATGWGLIGTGNILFFFFISFEHVFPIFCTI